MDSWRRFAEQTLVFHGIVGHRIAVPSANPGNYFQAITETEACPAQTVEGLLFLQPGKSNQPLVILVPGSLGVGKNHLMHAETLLGAGFAVFVLDPFGPRSVTSTVANQTAYSFAASAFDVLAAHQVLAQHPEVNPGKISWQGHSRGGSAVLTAATRCFIDQVAGPEVSPAGVYAVYPWCGHQFSNPKVGRTKVRVIMGSLDEWCSPQQAQGQMQAIAAAGGSASMRLVAGAHHSFDRSTALENLADAAVAPSAPTVFLDERGAMIDPMTGLTNREMTDLVAFRAANAEGFGRRGARIGGSPAFAELFVEDMLRFHQSLDGAS